jgi:hypothetical protein
MPNVIETPTMRQKLFGNMTHLRNCIVDTAMHKRESSCYLYFYEE